MDKRLELDFVKWNNANHRNAIENNGVCVWNVVLTDLPFFEGKQPRVSVVFSRYQGTDVNQTVLVSESDKAMGYVLAIPSYWLDVDQYLVLLYISNYIDDFINKYYPDSSYATGGTADDNNCPICPDNCPSTPPSPYPPCSPPPPPGFNYTPPFDDHMSPVGPPIIMSPPRPDPNISEFNKT